MKVGGSVVDILCSVTTKQWQYLDPQPDNLANDLKFIFQILHLRNDFGQTYGLFWPS